jgi:hypothetical protein
VKNFWQKKGKFQGISGVKNKAFAESFFPAKRQQNGFSADTFFIHYKPARTRSHLRNNYQDN